MGDPRMWSDQLWIYRCECCHYIVIISDFARPWRHYNCGILGMDAYYMPYQDAYLEAIGALGGYAAILNVVNTNGGCWPPDA